MLVFPAVAAAECPPALLHTTPAKVDDSGRLYVPLTVQGHTVQALVCTSCPWSSLGEQFVDRVGIKKRAARVRYVAVDGSEVEFLARPKETKLGDMTLDDDYIVDSGSGEDASIGLNLLIYFDFEVDNGKKTVSFYRHQKHCNRAPVAWPNTVSMPFDLKDEVIKAVVDANGRKLRAGFYTGSPHTMMEFAVARHQFGVTPATPGVRKTGQVQFDGAAKPFDTYEYMMPQMTLSGLTFKNVPLRLIDLDGFGINLGMHELKQTRFFVAFSEQKIYAAPVEGAR
jgi:hypothetical protein